MSRTPAAYTAAIALVLASTLVQGAEARSCYYDRYGRYRCTGLLSGTLAGIIVACVIPVLFFLLLCMFCLRRRKSKRVANEAYITPQTQDPQMYQNQQPGYYPPYGGETQQQQQYPTSGQYGYSNDMNNAESGYAPPAGAPPGAQSYAAPPAGSPPPMDAPYNPNAQSYAPPPGPPPAAHVAGGKTGGESAAYYTGRQ